MSSALKTIVTDYSGDSSSDDGGSGRGSARRHRRSSHHSRASDSDDASDQPSTSTATMKVHHTGFVHMSRDERRRYERDLDRRHDSERSASQSDGRQTSADETSRHDADDEVWTSPARLREPPPPKRQSPTASPLVRSRTGTPVKRYTSPPPQSKKAKSGLSLVSYSIEDLDDTRRSSEGDGRREPTGMRVTEDSVTDLPSYGRRIAKDNFDDDEYDKNVSPSSTDEADKAREEVHQKSEANSKEVGQALRAAESPASGGGGGGVTATSSGDDRTPTANRTSDSSPAHDTADGGDDTDGGASQDGGDVQLPSDVEGELSEEQQARFERFFEMKAKGYDFNHQVQKLKEFRNPSIYEKLISHFNLDELGTNFPPEVFNPHGFKDEDFYDKLEEAQVAAMKRLRDADAKTTKSASAGAPRR